MSSSHRYSHVPGWRNPDEHDSDHPSIETRQQVAFLRTVPLLKDVDEDIIWRLAHDAQDEVFAEGTAVLHEGDDTLDKRFYIVREGAADVLQTPEGSDELRVVASLVEGDWFGEVGLLANAPRNATIRAASMCPLRVISFDATTFQGLIAEHVLIFRVVRSQRNAASRSTSSDAIEVRELGLFSDLPIRDLAEVLRDAEQHWYRPGDAIITQGEIGDRFYVLLDGHVLIERDGEVLAELGTGDFFGETALLFDCTRTATVRATVDTLTWSLSRGTFERIVRHYMLGSAHMRDTIASRIRNAAA